MIHPETGDLTVIQKPAKNRSLKLRGLKGAFFSGETAT
jgi:hypothetical protein